MARRTLLMGPMSGQWLDTFSGRRAMGSPGGLEGILSWQQNAPMVYATLQQRRPAASIVCRCWKQ